MMCLCMKFITIFLTLIVCSSCDDFFDSSRSKPPAVEPEKVLPIYFLGKLSTTGEDWIMLENEGQTTHVDLSKIGKIDSVIFKCSVRSERDNKRCVAQLYDLTNNVPIYESTVYSKVRYQLHTVKSSNLKGYISMEKVLLAIRIRSEDQSNYVEIGSQNALLVYYH